MRILSETSLTPAAHLTCVDATRAEVDEVIRDYWKAGMRHIVALRGDPPGQIGGAYQPPPDGYANATELTGGIPRIAPFEVSVGLLSAEAPGEPVAGARHRRAEGQDGRRRHPRHHPVLLRHRRLPALRRHRCARPGSTIPIVPGIMPVTNFKGLVRMAGRAASPCRTGWPSCSTAWTEDPDTRRLIACSVAAEMCAELEEGAFPTSTSTP